MRGQPTISVVTPTLERPTEIEGLISDLGRQELLPEELVIVDGAPPGPSATEEVVRRAAHATPFRCLYVRNGGGTAIQRNVGIDRSQGDLIAFIDDDIRLEPDFLSVLARVLSEEASIGGALGFRANEWFTLDRRSRWRWYRRLRLLSVYEAGRYDYRCGYPVNIKMIAPFEGIREVDFISTACALWRRQVFDTGLRFDPFFEGYGVLEDAHLSLRASRGWRLVLCGDARCTHLASPASRTDRRRIGYRSVVNYYYVFRDVAGPLSFGQRLRFWRFQAFELSRILASALTRRRTSDLQEVVGRFQGVFACARGLGV